MVGASRQMTVNRVENDIGFAADKPAIKRRVRFVQHVVEWFIPINRGGTFAPKLVGMFLGLTIQRRIIANVGVGGELGIGRRNQRITAVHRFV